MTKFPKLSESGMNWTQELLLVTNAALLRSAESSADVAIDAREPQVDYPDVEQKLRTQFMGSRVLVMVMGQKSPSIVGTVERVFPSRGTMEIMGSDGSINNISYCEPYPDPENQLFSVKPTIDMYAEKEYPVETTRGVGIPRSQMAVRKTGPGVRSAA